jgi:hypothetical protein
MAAAQGAILRELMERMGHSSTQAALIYLHATRECGQRIAAGMGKLFKGATATRQADTKSNASGTPQVTVNHRDLPSLRARDGHAARPACGAV